MELKEIFLSVMVVAAAICFIVSEITRNYSQTDKLWSIMPIIYSIVTLVSYPSERVWLMTILVTAWGLRLSFNFHRKGGYSIIPWKGEEDYRWAVMRSNPLLKGRLRFGLFNLLFISFYQHFLIFLFSTPLLIAAANNDKELNYIDFAAALFMVFFLIMETIADNQLFRFHSFRKGRNNPEDIYSASLKDGFFSEGLWKYVRHPNFASEQGFWITFYLFGVAASGNWINWTLSGPVLLVLLFAGSTMLTEKISSSKYPAYSDYQKKVPKFIPGLPVFRKK